MRRNENMVAMRIALFAVALTAALLIGAERLVLVNAPTYPRFLATDLGDGGIERVQALRKSVCKDDSVEIYPKKEAWIVRCGFAYYPGHTYLSHTDPLAANR